MQTSIWSSDHTGIRDFLFKDPLNIRVAWCLHAVAELRFWGVRVLGFRVPMRRLIAVGNLTRICTRSPANATCVGLAPEFQPSTPRPKP